MMMALGYGCSCQVGIRDMIAFSIIILLLMCQEEGAPYRKWINNDMSCIYIYILSLVMLRNMITNEDVYVIY